MQKDKFFPCPASNVSMLEPVIIDHPRVSPIIYNLASVISAAKSGELLQFGITADNFKNHIYVDHFTDAIINRLQKGKLTLDPKQLNEILLPPPNIEEEADDLSDLSCPVTRSFVTGVGALCTRDGRLYDFPTLKLCLQNSPTSPMNSRPINVLSDIIVHPVHKRIIEAHARSPQDLVNLENLLTNFQQPAPEYLSIADHSANPWKRRIIYGLFMLDPFLDYARILLYWQNPVTPILYLSPIAAAMIDIRLQYAITRRSAWTRMNFSHENPFYLNIQHRLPNLPPAMTVPSWFFYLTHFIKANLAKSGFHAIITPGFHQQPTITKRMKFRTMAIRELIILYRQYELLRAFTQIKTPFIANLKQRLIANEQEEFSLKRWIKRALEVGILLSVGGVFLYGVHQQTHDIAFYGAANFDQLTWPYEYMHNVTLREAHPVINSVGNALLYPISLSFSWPELCTLLITTYHITEALFGNQNNLPSFFSLNTALLMMVAMTLIPFMQDYNYNSIIDYLMSLIILGAKVVTTETIEQQLPRAAVGNRYRLLPQPDADQAKQEINLVQQSDEKKFN